MDTALIFLNFARVKRLSTLLGLCIWSSKNNVIKDYIWSKSFNSYQFLKLFFHFITFLGRLFVKYKKEQQLILIWNNFSLNYFIV